MRILWVSPLPETVPAPVMPGQAALVGDVMRADTVDTALRQLRSAAADLVLCDVLLRGLSGLELARRIAGREGAPPILLCTRLRGTWLLPRAIRAGARGLVCHESPDAVQEAMHHLEAGRSFWRASESIEMDQQIRSSGIEALTPRQFEALHLILQGLDDIAVAATMHVTRRSAAGYRRQLAETLRIDGEADLDRLAALLDGPFYGRGGVWS